MYSKIGKTVDCKSTCFEWISLSVYVGSGDVYGRSLGSPVKKRVVVSVASWQEEQLACPGEFWKK